MAFIASEENKILTNAFTTWWAFNIRLQWLTPYYSISIHNFEGILFE